MIGRKGGEAMVSEGVVAGSGAVLGVGEAVFDVLAGVLRSEGASVRYGIFMDAVRSVLDAPSSAILSPRGDGGGYYPVASCGLEEHVLAQICYVLAVLRPPKGNGSAVPVATSLLLHAGEKDGEAFSAFPIYLSSGTDGKTSFLVLSGNRILLPIPSITQALLDIAGLCVKMDRMEQASLHDNLTGAKSRAHL